MPAPAQEPINARTAVCAVFGHPVRHSASPAMHNAALAALGLNWRYVAFDVHPQHLHEAILGARRMKFIGLNLTVPHKLLAMAMADVRDESADLWGTVNTLCFEGRDERAAWHPLRHFGDAAPDELRTRGFNTDADALIRALREDLQIDPARARVLLLGAGGAGRTAALKLASEQVPQLFLVNRTAAKAEAVAQEIRARYPEARLVLGYPPDSVDLVLNATSLGLRPDDALPFAPEEFSLKRTGAVYDMIYRPAETRLLERARAAGCKAANGLSMLLYQGAAALELWTGRPAPLEIMRRALQEHVG